jgi:hypothetical protein
VIWEIILRALLTRALNLRPIAVHKSSIIYWYADHRDSKGAIVAMDLFNKTELLMSDAVRREPCRTRLCYRGTTGAWLCSNCARNVSVTVVNQQQSRGLYEAEAKVI